MLHKQLLFHSTEHSKGNRYCQAWLAEVREFPVFPHTKYRPLVASPRFCSFKHQLGAAYFSQLCCRCRDWRLGALWGFSTRDCLPHALETLVFMRVRATQNGARLLVPR